jgi:Ca2+-binding RTX toxin-like protein
MANFTITDVGTATGAAGDDRLTYTATIAGGVLLTGMTGSLAAGYAGTFNGSTTNDGVFTGIENFTFTDNIGGNDTINTLDGADILNGGAGNDSLNSGAGDDVLNSGTGDDTTNGGAGDDTINAGSGADSVLGGAGNDSISITIDGADAVDGGADVDFLVVTGAASALTMTSGSTIVTTAGTITYSNIEQFSITGSAFADNILLGASDDYANGAVGDDSINGAGGNDFLEGGDGNDTLIGGTGNDRMYGGAGNDSLTGTGRDSLVGGDGNDIINAGTGDYRFEGGDGNDMLIINTTARSGGILLKMTSEFITLLDAGNGTGWIKDIEGIDITAGSGSDKITTNGLVAMDDIVRAGGGNDFITINLKGSDTVTTASGEDRLTLNATDAVNGVTFALGDVSANGYSGTATDGVNSVSVTGINSVTFTGLGGADNIKTADGADRLRGGAGADSLAASTGSDRLWGDAGADTIVGGGGNDFMYGGADADVFVFAKAGNSGLDKIYDFENGSDLIRIAGGTNFATDVKSVVNSNGDAKITLTNGTIITLDDVAAGTINGADFLFT